MISETIADIVAVSLVLFFCTPLLPFIGMAIELIERHKWLKSIERERLCSPVDSSEEAEDRTPEEQEAELDRLEKRFEKGAF